MKRKKILGDSGNILYLQRKVCSVSFSVENNDYGYFSISWRQELGFEIEIKSIYLLVADSQEKDFK